MDLARRSFRNGKRSPVLVLPCGAGKTVIAAEMAKKAAEKGNRVLVIVHRREICEQIEETFKKYGVQMELCKIGMVQTVCNRTKDIEPPGLIIIDEAHHSTSESYLKVFKEFPEAKKVGLTATPERLDGQGLSKVYDDLVAGVAAKWLIENCFLARYRIYSMPLADVSRINVVRGEYDMGSLMESAQIYGDTVKNYKKLAGGLKAICYCASVKAAEETALEFKKSGLSAEAVSGKTPDKQRERIIESFRIGKIVILCNCDLLGEGIDIPDCSCVIMLRKTKSLTLYIQQAMRSMRYLEGKTAIIIDHVMNCYEHGFPDEERTWALDGKGAKKPGEALIKTCQNCSAVVPLAAAVCSFCGFKFPISQKTGRERVEGELVEVTPEMMKKRKKLYFRDIQTFEHLEEYRQEHGFKQFWVFFTALELGIEIPKQYERQEEIARRVKAM
jgi:superfamily II DNA or RNA helicase